MQPALPLLFGAIALASASPFEKRAVAARTVTALNTAAFEEAQQRDSTATRAFSGTAIKVFPRTPDEKLDADSVDRRWTMPVCG
jgi:hypothetical protein